MCVSAGVECVRERERDRERERERAREIERVREMKVQQLTLSFPFMKD